MEDRCVCCGEYVPEGRQICWSCENTAIRDRRMTDLESKIFHGWQDLNCMVNEEILNKVLKSFEN